MSNTAQSYNFDDHAFVDAYDCLPAWSAPFGELLLDMCPLKMQQTVLDIGCGTGYPLLELASRLGKTSTVFGLDPWEGGMRRAGKKIKVHNIENITLARANAENLPFPDQMFDLVVSNNGITNVDNFELALVEARRVLKKGGDFILSFNLPDTMKEFYDVFRELLHDLRLDAERSKLEAYIYKKRKSVVQMKSIVEAHSFQLSEHIEKQFHWKFLDGTTMFEYYFIRMYFLPSWESILSNADSLMIFNELEKRLNKLSDQTQGITLTIPYTCMRFKAI